MAEALRRGIGPGCGGPARGYSWPPFERGNSAAVRHGFFASPLLRPDDRAEVAGIADAVRELLPVRQPGFELIVEQLAVRLWRQRRAYSDLSEHGVVREDGKPAPILADLSKLESRIAQDLDALGLTPRSAVALGVDLVRGEREQSLVDYYRERGAS